VDTAGKFRYRSIPYDRHFRLSLVHRLGTTNLEEIIGWLSDKIGTDLSTVVAGWWVPAFICQKDSSYLQSRALRKETSRNARVEIKINPIIKMRYLLM